VTKPETDRPKKPEPSRWRRNVAIAIAAIFLLSAAARAFYPSHEPSESGAPAGSAGFVPGEGAPAQVEQEPTQVEQALPYVTEGSFFALIGFALGFLSRTLLKVGLVVLGLVAALLLGLSMAEVIDVDWGRAQSIANDLVLNFKDNATWTEALKDKVPSFGALGVGYALGFRK
jgi:uncharacterized membrane protein (Fun14 family)